MYQVLTTLCSSMQAESPIIYIGVLIASMLIGFYLLTKGGDLLSDHASNLAQSIGIPSVVVGLTIVSIATSAPELFTSIAAVASEAQGLILGNIIGSNIANISLILGISLLISPINTNRAIPQSQSIVLLGLSLFFIAYLFLNPSQSLSTFPGIILLLFIGCYLFFLTRTALQSRKINKIESKKKYKDLPSVYLSCIMILVATAALWVGSDTLVFGAKNLASLAGIPEELIGFTLVAIGTSLPELAASIALTKKNEFGMLLGNIVGSNIFNIGLVGGVAGILGPISATTTFPWIDYISLLLLTTLLTFWLRGTTLKKIHGVILLIAYVGASLTTWVFNS